MNPEYNDYSSLASLLAGVGQAIATRPQKSLVRTTSTSTSTPRALEYMIRRRDTIGANNQRLLDALKGRETFGYNVGAGLANLAPVSGYGDWGVNALRAFGGAMNRPTDAAIAREQAAQEMARKDLETALAYDKAMGETQTQAQTQTTEYKDMPYATGKAQAGGEEPAKRAAEMEATSENLGDLFQTIAKNPTTFSSVGGLNQTEEARGLRAAVTSQGLTDMGHREFAYLNSIMPKGFSTAINTAAEQKLMRPYTSMFESGAGSAKKAAIKNMIGGIYDEYAREAKAQGFEMPISKEAYINSRINAGREYNPKYFIGKSNQMYLDGDKTSASAGANTQMTETDIAEQFMRGTI